MRGFRGPGGGFLCAAMASVASHMHLAVGELGVNLARHSDHLARNASRAVATGWAVRQAFRKLTSFPLSSHADHDQLVEYVRKVNPKRVYVFTGYAEMLASEIERKLGIRAGPLPVIAQTKLLDFNETLT